MCALLAGKVAKASTIVAVDTQPGRLELAKKLGATHGVLAADDRDIVREIRDICPPNGADFAADCTGVAAVVGKMIDSLGTLGRAVTVGAPGMGSTVNVDIMSHLTYGKEYVGCNMGGGNPAEVRYACRKMPYTTEIITNCTV
jgi:Zn-dependent alcohol dehydrogenase